jgi:ubiquinone/menaquinone biosynthesis C-methylase UbiE
MESQLQKRVQRYGWDKAALYYETFWQQQLKPAQDLLMRMAAICEGEKVLDIACGTGLVSFRAAEQAGKTGSVLGTDISDRMIEMARKIAEEKKVSNTRFERMDAEQLELADDSFDVVICALGLMYVPDPSRAINEMFRVLKPGGRMVAAVWGERGHCGWAEIFEIVDKRVSSEVCPMFFQLGTGNRLELHLQKGGFEQIEFERIVTTLEYISGDEACGAAFEGGPVALAYYKFGDDVKQEARIEYINSISSYKNSTGYAVPGEFVVATGVKGLR